MRTVKQILADPVLHLILLAALTAFVIVPGLDAVSPADRAEPEWEAKAG